MDSAASRLEAVRSRIAHAAKVAGRRAEDVTLIAGSKTLPAEHIVPLIEAGHRAFGENRVQEAQGKWPGLKERWPDIALHLVGQLQSNKADAAVAQLVLNHSLDRPSLVVVFVLV